MFTVDKACYFRFLVFLGLYPNNFCFKDVSRRAHRKSSWKPVKNIEKNIRFKLQLLFIINWYVPYVTHLEIKKKMVRVHHNANKIYSE
jgi:hypothetical protein